MGHRSGEISSEQWRLAQPVMHRIEAASRDADVPHPSLVHRVQDLPPGEPGFESKLCPQLLPQLLRVRPRVASHRDHFRNRSNNSAGECLPSGPAACSNSLHMRIASWTPSGVVVIR